MTKNIIAQYVCFITELKAATFVPEWEGNIKKNIQNPHEPLLFEQGNETKNKFRYISKYVGSEDEFTFMNEIKLPQFPAFNVKVISAGGYISLENQKPIVFKDTDTRIIAFLGHNEYDLEYYKKLPLSRQLYISQAYYESCSFGHVIEFSVSEKDAADLILHLKQRPGVEAAIYRECLIHQL